MSAAVRIGGRSAAWLMLLSYLLLGPVGQGGFALCIATAGHVVVEAIPHQHSSPVEHHSSPDHMLPALLAHAVEPALESSVPAHPCYDAAFADSLKPEQLAGAVMSRGSAPAGGHLALVGDSVHPSVIRPAARAGPIYDAPQGAPFLVAHRTTVLLI